MIEKFYSGVEAIAKPKEESILRKQENMNTLFLRLQSVYNNRPDPLAKENSFVGAMSANDKFAKEYSEEIVTRDVLEAKSIRDNIDKENGGHGQLRLNHFEENFAFAEAAQAMITDLLNKWLPDFKTIMTSDFDDLKGGVDMVMKHKDGGYLGTALDVTVTGNPENIKNKLNKNWEKNIIKGSLPVVKYFQDPDTKEKGRIIVPKFIIGISALDVNTMAEAYLSGSETSLDSHPFRKLILEQIEVQLDDILNFYENNLDKDYLKFAYHEYLRVEGMIRESKKTLNESKIIDPLEYHEYAYAEKMPLKLIKEFIDEKNKQ